jgi:glycosyltransferase involved in cell wall biosynthesis
MRVLMTADTASGVWTYALELGGWLASRNAEVTLATMGARPNEDQKRAAKEANLELAVSDFKLEWMSNAWEDVDRAGEWLLGIEGRVKPDVIHLNGYAHGALAWQAPAVVVAHSCVLSWWDAVNGEQPPTRFSRYRACVARGIAAASVLVAPTRAMLASVERFYDTPRSAYVIPNGARADRFRPGLKSSVVLSAGRLSDRAKNIAALAKIAHDLPWPVFVAGRHDAPNATKAPVDSRGIQALGQIGTRALARWMARAPIFALPALYEPFGLSILEAGLSGCALVLGDIPSLRETWADAAVYVDPKSPAALARAIRRFIDDPQRREALGARARSRALFYSADRMGTAYLSLYRDVLRKSSGAPPSARIGA